GGGGGPPLKGMERGGEPPLETDALGERQVVRRADAPPRGRDQRRLEAGHPVRERQGGRLESPPRDDTENDPRVECAAGVEPPSGQDAVERPADTDTPRARLGAPDAP